MTNKKRFVAMLMVVVLALTAVIGTTLAYFTDTDDATNTFTVGNVEIHIDEYMVDETGEWVEYEDQTLRPLDNSKVETNKLVETVNDGTEDAYIRTFVTCPKDMYDILGLGFNSGANAVVGTNKGGENMYPVTWKDVGTFTINGEDTAVFLCEVKDKNAVKSGESVLSLTAVWLYKNVTNEMVDGFDLNNGEFVVEVASQAIQAENLTYDEAMVELGAIDQTLMDKLFN